jgi:hypothetical protein
MTITFSTIAVAISLAALCVALWNAKSDNRAAVAAEDAAVSSRTSSDAATVSAAAAIASADSAEKVARAELLRDHEAHRPDDATAHFERVRNDRTGREGLWFVFTAPRGYRMKAYGIHNSGSTIPLSVNPGLVVQAGRQVRVYTGELTGTPLPDRISMEFWPPEPMDGGELWTCGCGKPAGSEDPAHWIWNRDVAVPPDLAASAYSA